MADFTTRGIDAINFGPGATRYAHRRDELVEIDALVTAYETLLPVPHRLTPRARLPHPPRPGDLPVRAAEPGGRGAPGAKGSR